MPLRLVLHAPNIGVGNAPRSAAWAKNSSLVRPLEARRGPLKHREEHPEVMCRLKSDGATPRASGGRPHHHLSLSRRRLSWG